MQGKGPGVYRHQRGAVPVILQARGDGGGTVVFYADCDCQQSCEDISMHRGTGASGLSGFGTVTKEFRESGRLPEKPGVIIVDIKGTWSLDVVETQAATVIRAND